MSAARLVGPLDGATPGPFGEFRLETVGYTRSEYLLGATATSYRPRGDWDVDGAWSASPDVTADFTTRLVVHQPTDPARFDGTVVVEWLNVSAGTDNAPGWLYAHREIIRKGSAYVGVSAQRAGIEGGGLVPGPHLKVMDADRYAALTHPGDAFAYDIFSSAGRVVRDGSPLLTRPPDRLLAWGDSQSAVFLVTYINAVDPHAATFDGYLIQGRGGNGAPLDGNLVSPAEVAELDLARTAQRMSAGHRIRDDVRVPVMIVQSETDQFVLYGCAARQPDTASIRTWEIAGAAHADTYALVGGHVDDGSLPPAVLAKVLTPTTAPMGIQVPTAVNGGPQQHYVLQAALAHLDRWVRDRQPPPLAGPLETGADGDPVRDRDGIARGGVRTPWTDVPVVTYCGTGQSGPLFAIVFGTTVPLPIFDLLARYPGGAPEYRRRFADATHAATEAGFLLAEDEDEINGIGAAQWPLWPLG